MADPRFPQSMIDEDAALPTVGDLYGELDEDRTTEVMTVNIGPHHPATHGVLRLVVDLEGEVVRDLKAVIG